MDIRLGACTVNTMNMFIEEKVVRKFLGKPYSRTASGACACTVTARTCTYSTQAVLWEVLREELARLDGVPGIHVVLGK